MWDSKQPGNTRFEQKCRVEKERQSCVGRHVCLCESEKECDLNLGSLKGEFEC